MDVLSDVLRAVRLTGAVFFDVEARSPWVATTPAAAKIAPSVMPEAEHVIQFHAVTSGDCWAELLDGSIPPLHLSEGDIVILPMGDQHVFCSEPGLRAEVNLKIYYRPTDRQLPFQVTPQEVMARARASPVAISVVMRDPSIPCFSPCRACFIRAQRREPGAWRS
jgi:Cupin